MGLQGYKMKVKDLKVMLEQADQPDIFPLKKHSLWGDIPKDTFNQFLLNSRILPFLKLILLNELADDTDTYIIGRTHATFREYEGDYEYEQAKVIQEITLHNQTCTVKLSSREIWDYILDGLGISQICTDKLVQINWMEFVSKDDHLFPNVKPEEFHHGGWQSDFGSLVFFNIEKKFILTKDSIFTNNTTVKQLIEQHHAEWDQFLKEKHLSIDHEKYIQWLQQRFPGKIKIRMIG